VEEHLIRVEIKPDSVLVEALLGDLELAARIGVDIIAIRRNREWVINPPETEKLEKGDILIARGAPHGVDDLKGLAEGTIRLLEE
jgi:uncharacterized protein with PhoU and TrkA domain